jgi:hypothetical protein
MWKIWRGKLKKAVLGNRGLRNVTAKERKHGLDGPNIGKSMIDGDGDGTETIVSMIPFEGN